MAKKYKYTMLVKKVVHTTTESVTVIAENEKEAKRLAIEEAKNNPDMFEEWEKFKYSARLFSVSCDPVEE